MRQRRPYWICTSLERDECEVVVDVTYCIGDEEEIVLMDVVKGNFSIETTEAEDLLIIQQCFDDQIERINSCE